MILLEHSFSKVTILALDLLGKSTQLAFLAWTVDLERLNSMMTGNADHKV